MSSLVPSRSPRPDPAPPIGLSAHATRLHTDPRRPPRSRARGAHRPGRRDPAADRGHCGPDRRPPGLQPRCRRADPGPPPGFQQPSGRHPLGHRAPDLCPQTADRSGRPVRRPPPGRPAVGLPVTRRVGPRLDRELARLDRAVLRPRPCYGPGGHWRKPTSGRGDRRRVHDRGHGLRGAQQPGSQWPEGHRGAERQRPVLRPDCGPPIREPHPDPFQPHLHAPTASPGGPSRAPPVGR